MAYRTEKGRNGRTDLVIDGWEKGIADSPYNGIASIKNLDIRYYPGIAYVNYARTAVTISGGTMTKPTHTTQSPAGLNYIIDDTGQVWKQSSAGSTTFNLLTSSPTSGAQGQGILFWQNYLLVWRSTAIDICGDGTGDAGVTSSNWNTASGTTGVWPINLNTTITLTGSVPAGSNGTLSLTASIAAGATTATLSSGFSGSTGVYDVTFTDNETRKVTLTNASASLTWTTGLTNAVQNSIFYNGPSQLTISSYTDAQGNSRAFWNGPTGTYQLTFSNGQVVAGFLTQGSATLTINPILTSSATTAVTVTPLFAQQHMAFISSNDGNAYFCNGQYIGVLAKNPGFTFNKSIQTTYTFNYAALGLPQYETAIWLTELQENLLIAGVKKIYPWDRVSTSWNTPLPMTENINKTININNNIYILAGFKGNIYYSNGYSTSLLKKIPDSFWGLVDPYIQWGGIMGHRNKLYFQAHASTNGGSASALGIFSLETTPGSFGSEVAGSITLENQNSFGFTATATSAPNGVLIDYPTSSNDSYYSAWYNTTVGGIDYNSTSLYQNYEPAIETDIIPIGTFLESKNFENIEYKLDQPLANGDSIRLSYRTSLTGSFTLVGNSEVTGNAGTTTATATAATQVLADNFNSNIQNAQWVQFKVEFKCASSSSSFIRLREVRLHYLL